MKDALDESLEDERYHPLRDEDTHVDDLPERHPEMLDNSSLEVAKMISLILLIIACIIFFIAAFRVVAVTRLDLIALGLALLTLASLVAGVHTPLR